MKMTREQVATYNDKSSLKKQIREIISWHIGGTYDAKQKCAEEILSLFSVIKQTKEN